MRVCGLIFLVMLSSVEPLRLRDKEQVTTENDAALRSLVNLLQNLSDSRRLNHASLAKARGMYNRVTKNMTKKQIQQWVRQAAEAPAGPAQDQALIESELKNALKLKTSALYDRPYVEHKGQNDFLVMRPGITDPFVTVIPNSIYYDIQKKCVNWLDDCSIKGIRARLLRGVQGPYK